jgi:hypothetical protein
MDVFRGKGCLGKNFDYSGFAVELAKSLVQIESEPYLLLRDDDARMLVSVRASRMLLATAMRGRTPEVTAGHEYASGSRVFKGLAKECVGRDDSFVDPRLAMREVAAFFGKKRLGEHVDFVSGLPEPELLEFPVPIQRRRATATTREEVKSVPVPEELAVSLKELCEYLDEVESDPDVNLDFDDAIQIGSLCGGRISRKRAMYCFTYRLATGETWEFTEDKGTLEAIAGGQFRTVRVKATASEV